jgi:hypothetical protein
MNAVNQSERAAASSQERAGGGLGGWLLLFCLLLLVWQPVSLALVASSVLGAVTIRGLPVALVLVTRVLAASLGIAAGLALLGRRPGAVTLAKVSLAVSAATDVFVYTTPFFPNNRPPGDTPLFVGVSLAYHAAWMIYLFRSKRVKEIF